ncbi:hypothetical protein JCM10213v2_008775 [Rhodosporidiobolus nylandii]
MASDASGASSGGGEKRERGARGLAYGGSSGYWQTAGVRFQGLLAVPAKCVYIAERDARKASSAAYIAALELRIKQLEQTASGSGGTDGGETSVEQQNEALRSRILALERGMNSRGISISEVLDEGRAGQPAPALPAASAIPIPSPRPSTLGKRALTWDHPDRADGLEDDDGWMDSMQALKLDQDSNTLLYHGPSSALSHLPTEAAASPPRIISASLDYSPSPLPSAYSPPLSHLEPFPFEFLSPSFAPLDWSRNLPHGLITPETHDDLLDLFEAFFSPWCGVVDMKRFREDMKVCLASPGYGEAPAPTRTDFYSPMLHNAILALACSLHKGPRVKKPFPPIDKSLPALQLYPLGPSTFFAEQAELDGPDLAAVAFYNQAKATFESECERPMLSTVRALLFIASFNSNRAQVNLGYLFFGVALRCATALGVNVNSRSFVADGVISEDLWSIALGRFISFRSEDHEIELPPADPDVDSEAWLLPSAWRAEPAAGEPVNQRFVPDGNIAGQSSSCFIAAAKLAAIQSDLISGVYSLKNEPSSAKQLDTLAALSLRLEAFSAGLPVDLQIHHFLAGPPPPHLITLHLTIEQTAMLVHRPFYHRPNDASAAQSIKRCEAAADRVVQLVELYEQCYGICYGPLSNIQTVFTAATVFLLSARRSMRASKRLKTSLDGAEACCRALANMSATWKWAGRTHRILSSLIRKWSPGGGAGVSSATGESEVSVGGTPAAAQSLPPTGPSLDNPWSALDNHPQSSTAGTDFTFDLAYMLGGYGAGDWSGNGPGGAFFDSSWVLDANAEAAVDPSTREDVEPYVP